MLCSVFDPMRKSTNDSNMASFLNEPCQVIRSSKKYGRPKFLICSTDDTPDRQTTIQKRTTNYEFTSDKCLDFIKSRPPSNVRDSPILRKCSTSSVTRSNIPVRSSCCIFTTSGDKSTSDPLNKYSQTKSPEKTNTKGYTKSTSFQVSPLRDEYALSHVKSTNTVDTSINRGYYSLQRPRCFSTFDGATSLTLQRISTRPRINRWCRLSKSHMDSERRREYSLNLTIESISNVTSKKRYHCELELNGRTHARTSSRVAQRGEVSWSDVYELCNLDPVMSVTVNLYKELIEGKGDKRRNVRHKIAFVTINIEDLYDRHEVKKKLPMCKWTENSVEFNDGVKLCLGSEDRVARSRIRYRSDGSNPDLLGHDYQSTSLPRDPCSGVTIPGALMRYIKSKKDSDNLVLVISAKYQCIEILPLTSYEHLRQFILGHYCCLVNYLDEKLSGKKLEEIASSMVSIHVMAGSTASFIATSICSKIPTDSRSISTMLRANTIGSKAIETYMKLTGMEYLRIILEDFSLKVLLYPSSLEVDPDRLEDKSLLRLTQVQLCSMVQSLCQKIYSSISLFPKELKRVFVELRKSLELMDLCDFADQLISSCLFLRFICPAILNPYLYQLITQYPQDPRIIRNFTLISKSLQTLANQTGPINDGPSFKEPFMIPIHECLSKERNRMISFLRQVSIESMSTGIPMDGTQSKCQEYIDLGYELAVSHLYLADVFVSGEIDQKLPPDLCPLIPILDSISVSLCVSPEVDTSTTMMAQMLSESCKLLANNVEEEFTTDPSLLPGFHTHDSSLHGTDQNPYRNSPRNRSIPIKKDQMWAENQNPMNAIQLNCLWKDLVDLDEKHISDPNSYYHTTTTNDDVSNLALEVSSLSTSDHTPTSHNLTMDTSLTDDANSPSNMYYYYCQRPSIEMSSNELSSPLKSSPTKSIRMGTKAVQNHIQHKKPQNEMEVMRRIVSDTEAKYLLAIKQIHDKEEENRVLRDLLRCLPEM